ncbi:translation initiation factor eIF3 core subunit C [Martiniozyma asiatica (nom. inval.)]|nr:translation initiation factor eIF3 core subunit C [Martiniozyma asiatica]
MSFFISGYESEDSSDDELLYYSDDPRHQAGFFGSADGSSSEEESMSESEDASASSDESESAEDEDWGSDSDSESEDEAPKGRDYFLKKDFLKGGDDDSDSEDEKMIVKSAKEKYLDEINELVDQLETLAMVEEWVKISSEFDRLVKLISKHAQFDIQIPKDFIKVICILEDAVADVGDIKKLAPSQSKGYNIVKQRVKKESKNFSELVFKYRSDPDSFDVVEKIEEKIEEKINESSSKGVFTVVLSILETRGKKGVNYKEQIETLEQIIEECQGVYQRLTVYMLLISIRFELYAKSAFMPLDAWTSSYNEIISLIQLLEENNDYIITETASINEDITTPPSPDANGKTKIIGSISALIERLADELNAHLLYIDPNSKEYINRLKDESKMYGLIVRGQVYYSRILSISTYSDVEGDQLTRLIMRRLEFVYYKPVNLIVLSELNAWNLIPSTTDIPSNVFQITTSEADQQQTNELIDNLCTHLYQYSNHGSSSTQRKKAALMQSYYYAACDQFYRAREILHLTHVQAIVQNAEISIQVLFNRSIVQLGLCAFRAGNIEESRSILTEVATCAKIREVLGQGGIRHQNTSQPVTNDGETIVAGSERGRYVPFHMHINLELLETIYYITSVLVEIPLMSLQAYQGKLGSDNIEIWNQLQQMRRTGGSKTFRRVLEYAVRQYFRGPAEDARDCVIIAALDLVKGDWKSVISKFSELKVWGMMPNEVAILKMLENLVKEVALKTWIYCEAGIIKRYTVGRLSSRFELNKEEIVAIISRMIYRDEIDAVLKLDQNDIIINFQDKYRGFGDVLKNLADKINTVVEKNEKLSTGGFQVMMKKK